MTQDALMLAAETLAVKSASANPVAATYLLNEAREALAFHRAIGRRTDLIEAYEAIVVTLERKTAQI